MVFIVGFLLGLIMGAALGAYGLWWLFQATPDQTELNTSKLRAEAAEAAVRIAQAGQAAQHHLLTQAFPEPPTREEHVREALRRAKARRGSA